MATKAKRRELELEDAASRALPALTPAELAEMTAIETARNPETFAAFVGRVSRRFAAVPPHLLPLYDLIQRSRHEQVFATVSEPPRHGKTTTFSLGFAYRTLYDPACMNFYTTYEGGRAKKVGGATQKIVQALGVPLDRSFHGADDWKTTFGGGLMSTSKGGSITGEGANGGLVVADDLIKGAKESRSKNHRDDAWDYLVNDVMSRVEGGASLIVTNTRWHEDDVIGRIKKDPLGLGEIAGTKPWIHINMPAIHDGMFNPVDERLHPELARPLWLDVDNANPGDVAAAMRWYALARARGEFWWWALYQGDPRSTSGKLFGPAVYYNPYGSRRADGTMPFDWDGKRGCVVLDPAATPGHESDHHGLGVVAMEGFHEEAIGFVVDAVKFHAKMPDAARIAHEWSERYGLPLVIEGVGGFRGMHQMIEEIEPGIYINDPPMFGGAGKWVRAQPVAAAWNAGRYRVPSNVDRKGMRVEGEHRVHDKLERGVAFVGDILDQTERFTGNDDPEDDLVDMIVHGFNYLAEARW
jgi:hypothetical protein